MKSTPLNETQPINREALLKQFEQTLDYVEEAYAIGKAAHEVEQGIFTKLLKLGFSLLGMFFHLYGTGDQGSKLLLPNGKTVKRLDKLRTRDYLSIFGLHQLKRVVYGTREKKKIQWVPLDAQLSLPESKFSYLLQDWSQDIAGDVPFDQVNGVLGKILGITQSVHSLERTNRKMSASTAAFWEQKEPPAAEDEGALMVVQADGKGVVMRPEAGKEAIKGVEAPNLEGKKAEGKRGKKKMALVGAVYTVDPYIRTPKQVLDALFRSNDKKVAPQARPKPVAKHVRASLLRDANDTMTPSYQEIFSWQAQMVRERNPDLQKPVIFLMDGQESLWNAIPKYFPGVPVIQILDIIHATSYLWDAAHLFYSKGSTAATTYAKKQIERMLNGRIKMVIRGLRWKGSHEKLKGEKADQLKKICGYLENNRHRMAYNDYLAKGYPIASGVIEGACRNIIVDRMEHSGMRWVMTGAHAMLELRCIKLSGLWDEFTEFRIKQENERLYPGKAANDDCLLKVA